MDSDVAAKLKAEILESVGDLIDEKLGGMEPEPGPRLVPRPAEDVLVATPHITVFEWSKFAGDPEGHYTGTKTAWPSNDMSLKHLGPHESTVVYDAMEEELRVWGDEVPQRVKIGHSVVSLHRGHQGWYRGHLSREGFREALMGSIETISSHWSAVIEGFDSLPPPAEAA